MVARMTDSGLDRSTTSAGKTSLPPTMKPRHLRMGKVVAARPRKTGQQGHPASTTKDRTARVGAKGATTEQMVKRGDASASLLNPRPGAKAGLNKGFGAKQ